LDQASDREIESALTDLAEFGIAELEQEGLTRDALRVERSLDLRYRGQSHTLNLPWTQLAETIEAFHGHHRDRYGHRLDLPVELVNLRVRVRGPIPDLVLPRMAECTRRPPRARAKAERCPTSVARLSREDLGRDRELSGPAIIADALATTWLAPGWRARLDQVGNLMLERAVNESGPALGEAHNPGIEQPAPSQNRDYGA
jgi:N-methylhydantoinase A